MVKRDYYFDNAKFILIFFVVFGHLIHSYIDSNEFFANLYKLIYSFHMPAFILISGYFARGIYEKGYLRKITQKLILPYLIFQVIYSIFYYFLLNQPTFEIDLLNPHWSLWFLLSLFYWNLMLLIFSKFKPLYSIMIALLIGLTAGYIDFISNFLSLSRTFVFFPIFLAGYYLKKEHFQVLTTNRSKIIAGAFVAIIALFFIHFQGLDEKWLLGSKPYSELVNISAIGLIKRMGIYAINFLMVGCFFAFVPNKKFFFTKLGRNTLYVYLLHGFVVKTFRESEMESYILQSQTIIIIVAFSLLLTFFLSSNFITTIIQPIIELKWSKLKEFFQTQKESYGYTKRQSQ